MTLKPPTKTFPKLVMKEWPERHEITKEEWRAVSDVVMSSPGLVLNGPQTAKSLSDFTRVVEETGISKNEK